MNVGLAITRNAVRWPSDPAVFGETRLTHRELDRRTNAIARALASAGVKPGDGVGLFARNHRGFVQAQVALDKLGANTLLLNTGFAAPQLKEVCEREGTRVILYDEEFRPIVEGGASDHTRFVTWAESSAPETTLEELATSHDGADLEAPPSQGRTTILTSGTTGTPKGVMVTHGNLVDNLAYIRDGFELGEHSVSVTWLPSIHDMGLIDGILEPLFTGFPGVIISPTL